MVTPSSLLAATDDRKARLAKLKSLKRKQPTDEVAPPESDRSPSPPHVASLHLSGRNYDPETRGPRLGFESAPIGDGPTLEELAADVHAEVAKKAEEDERGEKAVDLFTLQPKRPNFDLKRDLDRKLDVLNPKTENAIARLVRERVLGAQVAGVGGAASEAAAEGGSGAVGMDGIALVEGLRAREKAEEEEEEREREEEREEELAE